MFLEVFVLSLDALYALYELRLKLRRSIKTGFRTKQRGADPS